MKDPGIEAMSRAMREVAAEQGISDAEQIATADYSYVYNNLVIPRANQYLKEALNPRITQMSPRRTDQGLHSARQAARDAQERAVGFRAAQVLATHDNGLHDVVQAGRAYPETGLGVMGSTNIVQGDDVTVLDSGYLSKPQTLGQSGWKVG